MDDGGGTEAVPAPGRTGGWAAFRGSPYFSACVLVLLIAAAAGLFAGSYTYAMANPTPRHIPVAVTGVPTSQVKRARFVAGMEDALGATLELHHYDTFAAAQDAVHEQRVFAILREPGA
ncbi:MAG TPA: ABC transporter permease, partial [Streptomyces sp.]